MIIVWIFGSVFVGVLVLAIVVKMIEVQRASHWLSTTGKIVTSKVQARKVDRLDDQTVGNFAKVLYEFQVNGKKYRGKRVSIGEEAPDSMVEETLAKYPVGTTVTVFYNPANPEQAVLERDVPPDVGKGIVYALIFFIGGAFVVLLSLTEFPQYIARYLPNPEKSGLVSVLAGAGVFVAMLGWANYKRAATASRWPIVTGQILKKDTVETDSFEDGRSRKMYRSRTVYSYEVSGRKYISDRLGYGATVYFSKPSLVSEPTPGEEEGSFVRIHYNPKNPAEAVLNPSGKFSIILWIFAGLILAGAAHTAGFI